MVSSLVSAAAASSTSKSAFTCSESCVITSTGPSSGSSVPPVLSSSKTAPFPAYSFSGPASLSRPGLCSALSSASRPDGGSAANPDDWGSSTPWASVASTASFSAGPATSEAVSSRDSSPSRSISNSISRSASPSPSSARDVRAESPSACWGRGSTWDVAFSGDSFAEAVLSPSSGRSRSRSSSSSRRTSGADSRTEASSLSVMGSELPASTISAEKSAAADCCDSVCSSSRMPTISRMVVIVLMARESSGCFSMIARYSSWRDSRRCALKNCSLTSSSVSRALSESPAARQERANASRISRFSGSSLTRCR